MLRGATYVLKITKHILRRCVAWRVEEARDHESGALRHLDALFQLAQRVQRALSRMLSSFQERVALKMQHSGRLLSTAKGATSAREPRGRWHNALLAKTYGKKYRKRRWVAKAEAKLLPHFAHGIDEFQEFIDHQRCCARVRCEDCGVEERERTDASVWLLSTPAYRLQ